MFTKLKNTVALIAIMGALAGCAAQSSTSAMKMNHSMCKKMMEQGKCDCCQSMGDMRTSGMMSGGKPMQCMPQEEKKAVAPIVQEAPKSPDAEEHKAHHPEKTP